MSIAQRSVAGEGELYPAQSAATEKPDDSAALTAFRCDSTNLPWTIFRAAFRANHIEEISQRARSVLAALARTVDAAKPFAAIFARRELLTGRAMQSMRTFYRSLDDLEAAGLIHRRPQARYVEAGLFGRAYLHLTDRAALLLGFVEARATLSEPVATESPQPLSPTFQQPSANVADGGIYKDLSPSSLQKRQPGQVPSDLQRLRSLGFLDFLIFKLMREAREQGKRLSDVVDVTWEHLKAAKHPICYLRALLRNPVDFGHQLRVKAQADEATVRLNELKVQADRSAKQHAGQTFVDAHGETKYVVGTDAESMTIYKAGEGVGRQATNWKEGFLQAIERGFIRRSTDAPTANVSPTLPAMARHHLAGLRGLLRPKAMY